LRLKASASSTKTAALGKASTSSRAARPVMFAQLGTSPSHRPLAPPGTKIVASDARRLLAIGGGLDQ
jgi:hypothetical protein